MLNLLAVWIVNALALLALPYVVPTIQIAGFGTAMLVAVVLGLINTLLKPLLLLLTLPVTLLTLGLFTIIVNGLMVYIALKLTPGITMAFWHSVLAGMVLSLINYIVSTTIEMRKTRRESKETV